MGFVNEFISEEDQKRYDFSRIKRPPLYHKSIRPYTWTVDRARDVFMVTTGGGERGFPNEQHFALWWHGDIVNVQLERADTGQISGHTTTSWRLIRIEVPPQLAAQKDEVIATLKEALTEYKVHGAGIPVASHVATFSF